MVDGLVVRGVVEASSSSDYHFDAVKFEGFFFLYSQFCFISPLTHFQLPPSLLPCSPSGVIV